MNSVNKISLWPQNTIAIIFLFDGVHLNILGLLGECVCIHCLDCSLVCAFTNCTQVLSLYPGLVTSHDSVKKFVPIFLVALKKRQGWPHSLSFVKVSQSFWYPQCTELMVTQSVHDNSIQSSRQSLWKFFRTFSFCETTFSMHALVDFLNEFISHNWVSSLTTFVMHISVPIPKFSAPFSHTTVTHNIITVYMTQ